jgi:DNA-binding CsgD family transcriptional regulator
LHLALTEIKDFTWHILEKNRLIENYTEEIGKLKKQNTTITDEQLTSIEALRNTTVLTDKEWATFKTMFEKVHPGYSNRLKLNYPDLTPAETRYLVFTKLNISAKEMAAMLGVSAEAVRNIRFRLKKKLTVEESNDLERMANEV